jgi:hypothetical protein
MRSGPHRLFNRGAQVIPPSRIDPACEPQFQQFVVSVLRYLHQLISSSQNLIFNSASVQ